MAADCLGCHKKDLDLQLKDREIVLLKDLNTKLQSMYDEAIVLTRQAQDTAERTLKKLEAIIPSRDEC